jgi:tRNA pseudouridine13 synthase
VTREDGGESEPGRAPHDPPLLAPELPAAGGGLGPAPEDFVVDEVAADPPSGTGDHLWLRIRKRGRTTQDVVEALSRAARVHPRDVGTAGMKDKHAVTTQWFSVPRGSSDPDSWKLPDEIAIIERALHEKKLRTGRLTGNRFHIRLVDVPAGGLERARAIVSRVRELGLPNYFGAQRFGHGGGNLARALAWLGTDPRRSGKRGRFYAKLYPSVVQSEIFNRYLTARRELGLDRLLEGEVVRLDGSGSVFVVEDPTAEAPRLERRDIHLTGPLPGPKMRAASGRALELEHEAARLAGATDETFEGLARWVDGTRRDLLVWPADLEISEPEPGVLVLSFFLAAGSYATQLSRELTHAPFLSQRAAPPEAAGE